jgi:predicted GIY-YIG superfamily endonuclease
MWYFYILQSQKDLNYFYKGSANRLEERLLEHNAGLVKSSAPYAPFWRIYS